ncbi:DNA alkylation repair protein [Pseudomonas sp. UBA1879]|uniref:DNA alkylation repair protein n=1 Tax=Pseudomonas sp. UBA1879 TaxID=1947305 RepID=UPI0025D55B35|nr:DNA alkylation repair protein [Pseudomonas sp. UBA1879]
MSDAPALKEIFNRARLQHIADETAAVYPAFDRKAFLALASKDLDGLSVMQRLNRVSQSLHAGLPEDYAAALDILYGLAPRLNSAFVSMILPEYVALYGQADFERSMDALKCFTTFGSSEFAVRHFLRRDFPRTLEVMHDWSLDENPHVRRLASEGSRPRLPWSFRLENLMKDPTPVLDILDNLKADDSLYVRKSVANHFNDITKDNPEWALDQLEGWSLDNPNSAWIARHALRSLIKKGDVRALTLMGAGQKAQVKLSDMKVTPEAIRLGERIELSFTLTSTSKDTQRLIIDYAIHYVKKSGGTSAKVFKLKTLALAPGESVTLRREQQVRNFTTRVHYAGRHEVDLLINGECLGRSGFDLSL